MTRNVETTDIERRLPEMRQRLREAGLPALLAGVDAGAFGTTPLNLEMLRAVSEAAATAQAASAVGPANSLFWAYLFTEEAADRLGSLGHAEEPVDDKSSLPGEQYRDLAGKSDVSGIVAAVLRDCSNFLRFYAGHPSSDKRLTRDTDSLRCLRSYFRLLSNTVRRLGPETLDAKLETPHLRFEGWQVSPAEMSEPNELLPVTFDDIVGNEEYVKAGRRLVRDIAGFDVARGENPKKVRNQVLFVLGTPGCGKTLTAHAVLRYFLELCEKNGLPARTRVIRRTDWASSYQNQSSRRLLEIFRDEVFNAPGVAAAYWPDIDTAFSARGDADIRQEEKGILGTLFGILDGTVGPKNGKWCLFCDANTVNMDEAVLSRLTQSPLTVRGPVAPADFVRLLRDVKLRGKAPWLPISPEEWAAVGQKCEAAKLSGRSVDAIGGRILTEIEDFEEPEEYFGLPFDEKKKLIEKLSRPIKAARVLELIDAHCRFEKQGQEKSSQERFRRRVEEIRLHLSAQKAAVTSMLGAPSLGATAAPAQTQTGQAPGGSAK